MSARTSTAEASILLGLDRLVLVTIQFPDLVLRLSDVAVDVPWADGPTGDPIPFYAGLLRSTDFNQKVDRFGGGGVSGVALNLQFSGDDIDVVGLLTADRWPQAAVVEVALVWPDEDWSTRQIMLAGARCTSFKANPSSGLVSMQVARQDESQGQTIGDDTDDVDGAIGLLVSHDAAALRGRMMPVVIGRVRHVPAIRSSYGTATDYLVIAGHPIDASQTVELQDNGAVITAGPTTYTATPYQPAGADFAQMEGQKGSASVGGATWDPEATRDATHFPGTITASFTGARNNRGEPTVGLGRVLEYVLQQSGLAVDWPRMQRTIRRAHAWDCGVYVSQEVDALELIRSRLMPTCPLSEQRSEAGLWFAWTDPTDDLPVTRLVEGQNWHRVGGLRSTLGADKVRNSFSMRFGYHHHFERFMDAVRVDRTNCGLCAHSWTTFGDRPNEPIEATHFWHPAAAYASLRFLARQRALPRSAMDGYLEPTMYWLEAGDVVLVTDDAFGWTDRLAVISERSLSNPAMLMLEVVEQLPEQRISV